MTGKLADPYLTIKLIMESVDYAAYSELFIKFYIPMIATRHTASMTMIISSVAKIRHQHKY